MRGIALGAAAALGLSAGALAQYDSGGFEGFTLGPLPGQDGWIEDSAPGQDDNGRPVNYDPVPVVVDPTGSGHGNVICLDPPGTGGGWQGVAIDFADTRQPIVTVEWDQHRASLGDNMWMADAVAFDGWWAIQWDQSLASHSQTFDESVALTAGVWQHVRYTFDYGANTVTVDVDGATATHAGIAGTAIRGWVFELEPTTAGGEDGPTYIDNFVVRQVPAPGAVSVLALAGLALARRRR